MKISNYAILILLITLIAGMTVSAQAIISKEAIKEKAVKHTSSSGGGKHLTKTKEAYNNRTNLTRFISKIKLDIPEINLNETNQTNRTKHLKGFGAVTGNGTGEGLIEGAGFINLTDFTGRFSFEGEPGLFIQENCNDLGEYWECTEGNVRIDSEKESTMNTFFNGEVEQFYIQGDGEAWFTGLGVIEWEKCLTPTDGLTITEDSSLCTGNYLLSEGLRLATDNITLNCNKANLYGDDWGVGFYIEGIGVTLNDCSARSFTIGLSNRGYEKTTVKDSHFENNDFGLSLWNSDQTTITDSTFKNNEISGIWLSESDDWEITNNLISRNGNSDPFSGGVYLSGSNKGLIASNDIEYNLNTGLYANQSNGTIYKNNFLDNTESVILLDSRFDWFTGIPRFIGNYWSNYDSEDEGCFDLDLDYICDAPLVLDEFNTDIWPFNVKNGWDLNSSNLTFF